MMIPQSDEHTPSQSPRRQDTTPEKCIPATSRESTVQCVPTQERYHESPQQNSRALRPIVQPLGLQLLRNLLPANLLRAIGEGVTEENVEAKQVHSSDSPRHTGEEEQRQTADQEAVPNYRPSHFRYDRPDISARDQTPTLSAQREILPERPVNRVLFTEEDSDEDKSAPILDDHVSSANPNPQNAGYETRGVSTIEEAREVIVKVEPELVVIESDESQHGSDEEPSSQTGIEDAVEAANNDDSLSVDRNQGEPRDTEHHNVTVGQRQQAESNHGRRGTKRRLSEEEAGYWLRSRKPPSSTKRSRRTTYWLRPKRSPATR